MIYIFYLVLISAYIITVDVQQLESPNDTCSIYACEKFCRVSGGSHGQLLDGAHCLCREPMKTDCSLIQCLEHCHKCGEQYIIGSCFKDNCFCASHDNL